MFVYLYKKNHHTLKTIIPLIPSKPQKPSYPQNPKNSQNPHTLKTPKNLKTLIPSKPLTIHLNKTLLQFTENNERPLLNETSFQRNKFH